MYFRIMRERIKQIMDEENLTPAKFADKLQINRAVISHILNGRNNPSLDVVTKILSEMPYINSEWLIKGSGAMYKERMDKYPVPQNHDLFNQRPPVTEREKETAEKNEEIEVRKSEKRIQNAGNEVVETLKKQDKKIAQIIIYYNDNTFETFIPHP